MVLAQVDRSHGGTDGEGWSYPVRKGADGPQQGPEELRRRAEDRRRAVMLRRRVWVRHRKRQQQPAGTGATMTKLHRIENFRFWSLGILWQALTDSGSPAQSRRY